MLSHWILLCKIKAFSSWWFSSLENFFDFRCMAIAFYYCICCNQHHVVFILENFGVNARVSNPCDMQGQAINSGKTCSLFEV
jgi:hypothetical protein